MGSRVQLHNILLNFTSNVYFQSPEGFKMSYPCIRYDRTNIDIVHANDRLYKLDKSYTLTVITSDADSTIAEELLTLPMCSFERRYTADNLYHDILNIYY